MSNEFVAPFEKRKKQNADCGRLAFLNARRVTIEPVDAAAVVLVTIVVASSP